MQSSSSCLYDVGVFGWITFVMRRTCIFRYWSTCNSWFYWGIHCTNGVLIWTLILLVLSWFSSYDASGALIRHLLCRRCHNSTHYHPHGPSSNTVTISQVFWFDIFYKGLTGPVVVILYWYSVRSNFLAMGIILWRTGPSSQRKLTFSRFSLWRCFSV